MAIERTLSIIKPDAVAKNVIGKIYTRFEDAGLKIVAARLAQLSRAEAEGFYAVHKERPFFKDLVDFMVSGPVMMALADVALYVAILAQIGLVPLTVTTSLSINFLRKPQADRRLLGRCKLMKLGKSLAVRCFSMHTFDEDIVIRRALMQEAIELMANAQVKASECQVFKFSEVRQTHALLDRGMVRGKLVMHP